jgi:ribosomal protein S18 acetylase RimI-like enzyme
VISDQDIVFRVRPDISTEDQDQLRAEGFEHHVPGYDWSSQLDRSLLWIGAFAGDRLVGFVNLAWDGGVHTFLLDTAVAADMRHRGIGTRLVREAISAAREHAGVEWVHVDADEELMRRLYLPAGFSPSPAGITWVGD